MLKYRNRNIPQYGYTQTFIFQYQPAVNNTKYQNFTIYTYLVLIFFLSTGVIFHNLFYILGIMIRLQTLSGYTERITIFKKSVILNVRKNFKKRWILTFEANGESTRHIVMSCQISCRKKNDFTNFLHFFSDIVRPLYQRLIFQRSRSESKYYIDIWLLLLLQNLIRLLKASPACGQPGRVGVV